MKKDSAIAPVADIYGCILALRNQRVILNTDLAAIYQVEVRALLQAVKRNPRRFPPEFLFRLASEEFARLRSQTVISKEAPPAAGSAAAYCQARNRLPHHSEKAEVKTQNEKENQKEPF